VRNGPAELAGSDDADGRHDPWSIVEVRSGKSEVGSGE
jgi:hypothetical protein